MCDCINPFAWLLESIAGGVTLEDLKAQGLVGEGVTLEELLPRCMCGSSVPAQRDTDTAPSERAQVVEDAVREDEAAYTYERHILEWMRELVDADCYSPSLWVYFRRSIRQWRRGLAIERGARPYVPRYALAPDVVTFEGEVYRVVDVPGWSAHWGT